MTDDNIKKDSSLDDGETEPQEETENPLGRCEKERDEYLDGWKRAKADLANYKKDEAKRFEEIIKFGQTSLIRDLIIILDSFDLALISKEIQSDPDREKGLYLIRQQLEDILSKNGLERIMISAGDAFDPAFHEALGEIESDKPSGAIAAEVERGYLLNGKLIRPARVKISK